MGAIPNIVGVHFGEGYLRVLPYYLHYETDVSRLNTISVHTTLC